MTPPHSSTAATSRTLRVVPGAGYLVARCVAGRTAVVDAYASSPLRYVMPTFAGQRGGVSVCLVTFGGGLVDGDHVALDVTVEPGATLVLFTQASTKVFRGRSSQVIRARVFGTLVVLLDPVACFRGARYTQRTEIELGGEGACVLLDGFTSGRPAFGERWVMDGLHMRTRVTREGVALLDDAVRLDEADAPIAPRLAGYDAFLTLASFGARATPVRTAMLAAPERARASSRPPTLVAPSAVGDSGAIVRFAAARPEDALAAARHRMRNLSDIDAVDTFGARR